MYEEHRRSPGIKLLTGYLELHWNSIKVICLERDNS